jgi:hypothetical protein
MGIFSHYSTEKDEGVTTAAARWVAGQRAPLGLPLAGLVRSRSFPLAEDFLFQFSE